MFDAIVIEKADGQHLARLAKVEEDMLPPGNVTVRVAYSTLNYKDALAITGKAPVIRRYPMIPGIDFSGVVEASDDPQWKPGDHVVLNGWGVGRRSLGRVGGDGARERRVACAPAGAVHAPSSCGCWNGGLHGDALRNCPGTARRPSG